MDAGNRTELWQTRMRELSGAIMISALFQVFIGFFGINILIFFTLMLIHIINQKVRLFGCIDVCRSIYYQLCFIIRFSPVILSYFLLVYISNAFILLTLAVGNVQCLSVCVCVVRLKSVNSSADLINFILLRRLVSFQILLHLVTIANLHFMPRRY